MEFELNKHLLYDDEKKIIFCYVPKGESNGDKWNPSSDMYVPMGLIIGDQLDYEVEVCICGIFLVYFLTYFVRSLVYFHFVSLYVKLDLINIIYTVLWEIFAGQ